MQIVKKRIMMRHKKFIIMLCLCLIVGMIGVYFAGMPYPVRLWWAVSVHGPMIDPDIDQHLVSTLLKDISRDRTLYERAISVKRISPTLIRITTLQQHRGFLAQRGKTFDFTSINGEWKRTSATPWYS